MKTRLFIGNLASSVTQEELKDKFEALITSNSDSAQVGEVEVRCKNENNYFGFVDVHFTGEDGGNDTGGGGGSFGKLPLFLRKSIDVMNNTKWKGSLIKVQPAKESFMEKLKREQCAPKNEFVNSRAEPEKEPQRQHANFEINRNQQQADDVLAKLNRTKQRREKAHERNQDDGRFGGGKGNAEPTGDCGFEIVSKDSKQKPVTSPPKGKRADKFKSRKKRKDLSSDDSSDEDQKGGIPKFKGILFNYPDGFSAAPVPATATEDKSPSKTNIETCAEPLLIQQKLLGIANQPKQQSRIRHNDNPSPSKGSDPVLTKPGGINFKRSKQLKSDMLRVQSFEKMKERKSQRSNVISAHLSSVTVEAPTTSQRKTLEDNEEDGGEPVEPTQKKAKMTLFDDDEDCSDTDGDKEFELKKQYEGAEGQRLLELKTRWANDNRFKLDDRFKEDEGEPAEEMEIEKEKQLDILTSILGKSIDRTKTVNSSAKKESVILPRYDPEAEDDNAISSSEDEDNGAETSAVQETSKSPRKSEKTADNEKDKPEIPRSTEPATVKTAANLKALFSSGDNDKEGETAEAKKTSFSLLATFGKSDSQYSNQGDQSGPAPSSQAPRNFWQSNPFKYDSSDDEDDDKVKVKIDEKSMKPNTNGMINHSKVAFFFKLNDPRFEGLEDFFLKDDEEPSAQTEDGKGKTENFDEKRQELKAIVKAKIKNAKRKDEKKTLARRRAMRQRKRKLQKSNYLKMKAR